MIWGRTIPFLYFLKNEFIYFWVCWVFVDARGLHLVSRSRSYSLVAVGWLLTVVASPVAGYGLQSADSVVVTRWLSSCGTHL